MRHHWQLHIIGGRRLCGTVEVSGSKNAALPMMAAAILAEGPVRLEQVPALADVDTLTLVLAELGVAAERSSQGNLVLETIDAEPVRASYELVRRMRASFCVLGPLLARRGRAVVSLPGGCNIGPRPVDLHLKGLAALGAEIEIRHGYVHARANGLRGATIRLSGLRGSTVTGTANVLCAAVLARGETVLLDAAQEPEIADLARLLIAMGARIDGVGTATLRVRGVDRLEGATHRVIPDRIEAATMALAVAATRGCATIAGVVPEHLEAVVAKLRQAGCDVEVGEDCLAVEATRRLEPVEIVARPCPGIPSDIQAQWMATLALARGQSRVTDRVFPGRFTHVAELHRLGARIEMIDGTAVITGMERLSGARVVASDLRASAALVVGGLAAEGETIVAQADHLDRGYQQLDAKVARLGGVVRRGPISDEEQCESVREREQGCAS